MFVRRGKQVAKDKKTFNPAVTSLKAFDNLSIYSISIYS